MEEKDYELVIAKVPKYNEDGEDISGDELGTGGRRRDDGKLSALAYDLVKIEDEDDDNEELNSEALSAFDEDYISKEDNAGLAEFIATVSIPAIIAGVAYLVGRYQDEIIVAFHKSGRWIKTNVFKKQISEEKVYLDDLRLLNKTIDRIEKANAEIIESPQKRKEKYAKVAYEGFKKLSYIVKKYNSLSDDFSLQLLIKVIFPLKVFINNYENVFYDSDDIKDKWAEEISKLNIDRFIDELRKVLNQDIDVKNGILLKFPDEDIDDERIADAIKTFLIGKAA